MRIPRKPVGGRQDTLSVPPGTISRNAVEDISNDEFSASTRLTSQIDQDRANTFDSNFNPESRHHGTDIGEYGIPLMDLSDFDTESPYPYYGKDGEEHFKDEESDFRQPARYRSQMEPIPEAPSAEHSRTQSHLGSIPESLGGPQTPRSLGLSVPSMTAEEAAFRQHSRSQSFLGEIPQGFSAEEAAFRQHSRSRSMMDSISEGIQQIPIQETPCAWLPTTLRLPFMAVLFLASLGLGCLTVGLTIYSQKHHGFGPYQDTTSVLFAWRFTPTILAVIYNLLLTMMANDVHRTEAFARLSRTEGATAADSLFLKPHIFSFDPIYSPGKKRANGSRNLAPFLISLTRILALLVVIPFSGAFIAPEETFGLRIPKQRLVVNLAASALSTAVFLLSALVILAIAYCTRLRRRPLNIAQDPRSIATVASLIRSLPATRALFEGLDRSSEKDMLKRLDGYIFYLRSGQLHAVHIQDPYMQPELDDQSNIQAQKYNDWHPPPLRLSPLTSFLSLLFITVATITVLFSIFHDSDTHHIAISNKALSSPAAYSIIPTLFAVLIKLWWSSIDDPFRKLQPFISMARHPTPPDLSYTNGSSFFVAGKAFWNTDWLLSLLATGSGLADIRKYPMRTY
jgi:hypothetical protein